MPSTVIDRNSTSFAVKLLEFFRSTTWATEWDFLKYYQNTIRLYMTDVESGSRGLLVNVMMGLGKSITAVAVAMEFIDTHNVLMLMAKSIQENMMESIKKYIALRGAADPNYPIARLDSANLDHWISQRFSFVSMNAGNMLQQLGKASQSEMEHDFDQALESKLGAIAKLASLDNKMIVVDEAHNLFRAITHGSKNAIGFYRLVMKAKNLRIIFLTGTPIANNPFELVPCFNMLAGKELFPENYKDFVEAYVAQSGGIMNKAQFQNRIFGMVSYVDHSSKQGAGLDRQSSGRAAEFPQDLGTEVHRVKMTDLQYVSYRLAREKELEESTRPSKGEAASMTIPKSGKASTYRVHSRQLSNYAPPPELRTKNPADVPLEQCTSPKFEAIWKVIQANPRQLHLVYSQFKGLGGLGTFARFLESKGLTAYNSVNWAAEEQQPVQSDGPADLMPKTGGRIDFLEQFDKMGVAKFGGLDQIDLLNQEAHQVTDPAEAALLGVEPGDIVPPFATYAAGANYVVVQDTAGQIRKPGLRYEVVSQSGDIGVLLKMIAKKQEKRGGGITTTFAAITGDVPVEERKELVKAYTSPDNAHGEKIQILLITATGAESLDLKNMRHIHILEPYWTYGRIEQVKYRGIRNDSHIVLPPEEKNVATHVYLAVSPQDDVETTDTEIYNDSVVSFRGVKEFTEAIREVSIECMVNAESWCRVCSPTGQRLFGDFQQDLRRGDPCQPYVEKKISAQSIDFAGQTYYFVPDDISVFGYKIFILDPTTKLHTQLQESEPRFLEVLDAIEHL